MFVAIVILVNLVCIALLLASFRALRFAIGVGKVYFNIKKAKKVSPVTVSEPTVTSVPRIEPAVTALDVAQPVRSAGNYTVSETSDDDLWSQYDSPAYLRKGVAVFC